MIDPAASIHEVGAVFLRRTLLEPMAFKQA
jgi:hypothetical protein